MTDIKVEDIENKPIKPRAYSGNFITELKEELLDRVRFRCEIQKEYKPEIRERERLCEDCELRNTCIVNPILKDIHAVFDLVNGRMVN